MTPPFLGAALTQSGVSRNYAPGELDAAARKTLDSAMRNGVDWLIREGRLPTPAEVMEYARRAAPDAVKRWQLDGDNKDLAEARAQAVIERAIREPG